MPQIQTSMNNNKSIATSIFLNDRHRDCICTKIDEPPKFEVFNGRKFEVFNGRENVLSTSTQSIETTTRMTRSTANLSNEM